MVILCSVLDHLQDDITEAILVTDDQDFTMADLGALAARETRRSLRPTGLGKTIDQLKGLLTALQLDDWSNDQMKLIASLASHWEPAQKFIVDHLYFTAESLDLKYSKLLQVHGVALGKVSYAFTPFPVDRSEGDTIRFTAQIQSEIDVTYEESLPLLRIAAAAIPLSVGESASDTTELARLMTQFGNPVHRETLLRTISLSGGATYLDGQYQDFSFDTVDVIRPSRTLSSLLAPMGHSLQEQ
jgi:hypothetical protein